MEIRPPRNRYLLYGIGCLYLWFFVSSISIAWHRAPSQDDAMFATVVKNLLRGEGWVTNYGEPIPFNPDLTAGPVLLLSAVPLMSIFGNAPWVPAMAGVLTNILLVSLILHQLYRRHGLKPSIFFSLLLSLSLFAVNDFKTFSGYYSSVLLFFLACLIVSDLQRPPRRRLFIFGMLMAVGFYIKPLIALSFIAAIPFIVFRQSEMRLRSVAKAFIPLVAGFVLIFSPWHIYKKISLSKYDSNYVAAHHEYATFFFETHGSGIAQFNSAENKLWHLKKTLKRNSKIIDRFLGNHFGISFFSYLIFIVALFGFYLYMLFRRKHPCQPPYSFDGCLVSALLANLVWFIFFAFALTPGHAFFFLFISFFLLFYCLAAYIEKSWISIVLSIALVSVLSQAINPLIRAYSFRNDDPVFSQSSIKIASEYAKAHLPSQYLAGCGYAGAPWRLIYAVESTAPVKDCYHLLQDSIYKNSDGSYAWRSVPDFILVTEGFGLLGAVKSQKYILEPMLDHCTNHMIFQHGAFGFCRIDGNQVAHSLDPAKAQSELQRYEGWYRTRLRPAK